MTLESEFHEAMLNIYVRARKECGYNATRFLQMVGEDQGLNTAKRLLASDAPQYGFTELWELKRLDLTMENLVLQEKWATLFTVQELGVARGRLAAHNFDSST